MIDPIQNAESGSSVRGKLNAAIAGVNAAASAAPVDGNYRMKNGTDIQLRETAPTPGFRTIWLEDGVLQFGPLDES